MIITLYEDNGRISSRKAETYIFNSYPYFNWYYGDDAEEDLVIDSI